MYMCEHCIFNLVLIFIAMAAFDNLY